MGKKPFRTLLCALLIASMMGASAWAETAVVTGNEVNMREGPGTNFRVVDCLPRGAEVTVTDRSNAPWYCVEYDGQTGFMSASFLEISEEEAPQQQTGNNDLQALLAQGQEGYVDAMYVRFRSAPGSDYSVLGEYNRGKSLLYYGTIGDWAACIIDGRPGYLFADYVALGRFNGWSGTAEEEQTPYTYSTGLAVPTPAPESRPIAASAELGLEHAGTPGVEQTPGYINANYVRFRKGPASSYPIIETYNAGTPVGINYEGEGHLDLGGIVSAATEAVLNPGSPAGQRGLDEQLEAVKSSTRRRAMYPETMSVCAAPHPCPHLS